MVNTNFPVSYDVYNHFGVVFGTDFFELFINGKSVYRDSDREYGTLDGQNFSIGYALSDTGDGLSCSDTGDGLSCSDADRRWIVVMQDGLSCSDTEDGFEFYWRRRCSEYPFYRQRRWIEL